MGKLNHRRNDKRVQVQQANALEFKYRRKSRKQNTGKKPSTNTKGLGNYWGNKK